MAVIEWDQVGERIFQRGVDRGVLYLNDGTAVPWNGLTAVEDSTSAELKSYYLDGIKILDHVSPGDFLGKLSAFTYPEEFNDVMGVLTVNTGLSFYDQESKSFNLSYRTKISSDVNGELGYKIHLLYNLKAVPDSQRFQSISTDANLNEFSWTLSGTPPVSTVDGIRPTVHVSIDSTNCTPELLEEFEGILYGTESTDPRFPTLLEVRVLFGELGGLVIVDNGDGTWTAIDESNDFINMLDADTFEIDHVDATYLDPDTYTITDTESPIP